LETPLVEQIVEADRLMEHLLPRSVCIDEDALFSSQDDHSTCLDTTLWDPGADDSSKLSAQEDTTILTGYNVIQKELASSDGIQWHTRVPSSTIDSGQFITSSYAEGVLGDSGASTSRTDASSEGSEVAPQYDHDQESHHSVAQLRFSEDIIRAATRCTDDMHVVMAHYCWRASVAQEDIAILTEYNVIHKELASSDGIQWHTIVPSSTVDSGQFSMSSYVEGVFGDSGASTSRTGASSEGSEVGTSI
jgi:hypothetical protein